MTALRLPERFGDLERFVDRWDLPDSNARLAGREASSMPDLLDFHGAMMPRGEEIKAYLDSQPIASFTDADKVLARLMFALVIVANGVEVYKAARVPDCEAARFTYRLEPAI